MNFSSDNSTLPLVSIGFPVFNGVKTVRRALDCMLAQTFTNFEILVSDNASNDGSALILKEYSEQDSRIKFFQQKENIGQAKNFQFLVKKATSKYFMLISDDDWWEPNFIEALVESLEKNQTYGLAMSSIRRVSESGDTIDEILFDGAEALTDLTQLELLKRILKLHPASKLHLCLFALFRTDLIKKAMARPIADCMAGDRIFVCELTLATRIYSVPEVLFHKTVSNDPITVRYQGEAIGDAWGAPRPFSVYFMTLFFRVLTSSIVESRMKKKFPAFWWRIVKARRKKLKNEWFGFMSETKKTI